jgi:hypothetical protein
VNARLAKQTVTGFLDRLVRNNAAGTSALYLTESAQDGQAGAWLAQIADSEAQLAGATLYEFTWVDDTIYEAAGYLDWDQSIEGGAATQRIELVLVYRRGLWLIDEITLGPIGTETPSPTVELALSARLGADSLGNPRNRSELASRRVVVEAP